MTTIVSIDPGKRSGVCILGGERPVVTEIGDVLTPKHRLAAIELLATVPLDAACVIEDAGSSAEGLRWNTLVGLGKRIGAWMTLCSIRGLKPRLVHPNDWQSARLGRAKRAVLKVLSRDRAARALGREVGENAADAFNLARYMARERGVR